MRTAGPATWILISSLLFATMSALVKSAAADISVPAMVLFRNLPSALGLLGFAVIRGLPISLAHWRLHAIRSALGVTGMGLSFYAIGQLPLATATTLEYTAPLFIMLGLFLFGGKRVSLPELVIMATGFAGVLLLLRPTLQADQSLPFLAGLATGGTAAAAYRMVWRLGRAGEPGWRIVLFYSVVAVVLALLALPLAPASNYTAKSVWTLIGIGLVGMGAQLTMTHAFRIGSTTLLATLQYTTVIFSASLGVFFWGDRPTLAGTVGLVLILLSGVYAVRDLSRQQAG